MTRNKISLAYLQRSKKSRWKPFFFSVQIDEAYLERKNDFNFEIERNRMRKDKRSKYQLEFATTWCQDTLQIIWSDYRNNNDDLKLSSSPSWSSPP